MLGVRDVVVVVARPDALTDGVRRAAAVGVLSDADRAHVGRFRFEIDRDVALASRAVQRRALSARAPAIAPAAWQFATDASGRPTVAGPDAAPRLAFSAANTRGLVGCAVAAVDHEVGLDLEPWRDDAPPELIERCFAPAERAELAALTVADQPRRFVELWVIKEAYLKARGVGLGLPLEAIRVELGADAPRLVLDPVLGDDADSWQLALWSPTPAHAAAVCLRRGAGPPFTLHHRWDPG